MWIPDLDGKYSDILATSGESLKIYEINQDTNRVCLKADLVNVLFYIFKNIIEK